MNIQIGIDLGTTNSSVAINNNGVIEVIEKPGGVKYTPSVFGFDKLKNKVIGQKAYEKLYLGQEDDFKNFRAEIKRIMGMSETVHFERPDLEMSPEEISAEILKSLKEDILRKYPDFNTVAAVITVPAAFSILQSERTKCAGNLAGFKHVVLLQEPIAAAVAYGFGNTENENWLVYDLGGGTFDVALISLKDGILSVLGHNGDNFLGGKNIDWEIVDRVIVPKILEKFSLTNFNRNNKKYQSLFAKLKWAAEIAKIDLSQNDKTLIELGTTLYNNIGADDSGEEIEIAFDFSRKEFEKLINPLVDRTIQLSNETLKEAGIKNTAVEKIILVGGPTQIPYIRERLESDLKIPVDSSVDPLTVVARGAAIFALSQEIPEGILTNKTKPTKKGMQSLKLHYEMLTAETEEMITGVVEGLKDTDDEYYIQIQSDSGFYSGSKIRLKNGTFSNTIALEPNKSNLYWVYLLDKKGNSVPINPDSFTITHGLSVSDAPLPHSIGIVVVEKSIKNDFVLSDVREIIFEKGSSLPLKHNGTYKTARKLKKGDNDNPLDIILDEGESEIPDRNTFICKLGIRGNDLPYDLPEGTEVEITIEINKSRELFVTAYIPLIDLRLNARLTITDEILDVKKLEEELNKQTERAKTVSENCSAEERRTLKNIIESVQASVKNAHLDEDEKRKTSKQIKDLKIALDKLEKEKEMPQLIKEFHEATESVQEIINEYADEKDRDANNEQLSKMKAEGEEAISNNDKTLLIHVNEQIWELYTKIWYSNPDSWKYHFREIVSKDHNFINEKKAQDYIEKGFRAIELDDMNELKRCVRNLIFLIPSEEQKTTKKILSGITR